MVVKGKIKKGEYFDSVSLMVVGKAINSMKGILDVAVVMGTRENKSILESTGLLSPEFADAVDTDLMICIKAEVEKNATEAIQKVDQLLENIMLKSKETEDFLPKSLETAIKSMPDANLALISVAGKYASFEAMKALKKGLNVMIFSDNVPIEKEIALKKYANKNGLLVMGPDCGTAIINGVPLGFANVVNTGNVGIVAASGTGLQEVSSIISNEGAGISQAIGTGSRDVKKEVGGIMFIQGLKALNKDKNTKIIVVISKPPHVEVLKKIGANIKAIKKPVVAIFLGGNLKIVEESGAIPATTLEEAALIAVDLAKGNKKNSYKRMFGKREKEIKKLAKDEAERKKESQKYIRGLFCGGTLCYETQLIFKSIIGDIYGNTPLNPEFKLKDSLKSYKNTVVDLGEDEFTVGRPHPMIDYSQRNRRILEEASDPEVAVIFLDIVLGYGSNIEPGKELAPVIKKAKKLAENRGRHLSIICSLTGTEKDPQNRKNVIKFINDAGAIVMTSNAAASELSGYIIAR